MAKGKKPRRRPTTSGSGSSGSLRGRKKSTRQESGSSLEDKLQRTSRRRKKSTDTKSGGTSPLRKGTSGSSRAGSLRDRRAPAQQTQGTGSTGSEQHELQFQINEIQRKYRQLQAAAGLSDVHEAIGEIDARVMQIPVEIEGLRSRGYVHASLMEKDVSALRQAWEETRPRVDSSLRQEVARLQRQVRNVDHQLGQLSIGNAATISAASTALNSLGGRVDSARRSVTGLFDELQMQLYDIESALTRFNRVLDLFDESPEVRLRDSEAPVMAGDAEWHRDGDEGPSGILFLTDQRFLFEQNEEVATKKLFGLIATEKEKIQELMLDVPVHSIEQIGHHEEGGFLGMGKDDILDLVFGPRAPVSRARFLLRGQESSDWAKWIKQIQTGEMDRDRHEDFQEEISEAEARSASFPAECPNCFAPLPAPPRGARQVECEFCGMVVKPAVTG